MPIPQLWAYYISQECTFIPILFSSPIIGLSYNRILKIHRSLKNKKRVSYVIFVTMLLHEAMPQPQPPIRNSEAVCGEKLEKVIYRTAPRCEFRF